MAIGRRRIPRGKTPPPETKPTAENRWCERHGYRIDVTACRARAEQHAQCRRCLASWQQLSLPFADPIQP